MSPTHFLKSCLRSKSIKILFAFILIILCGFFNNTFLNAKTDPYNTAKKNIKGINPLKFEESSKNLDIVADHSALNRNEILEYPFRASAGVALPDLNNDGLTDVITTNWTGSTGIHIFLQQKTGKFQDVTSQWLDTNSLDNYSQHVSGAFTLDINNDGWLDLLITRTGCISIYLNSDGEKFTEITKSFLSEPICEGFTGANFADVNNDGFLDIYLQSASSNYQNPAGSGFNGLQDIKNILLINNNGTSFQDQTDEMNTSNNVITWGSLFYQGLDKNLILVTINDFSNNFIYFKPPNVNKGFQRIRPLPKDLMMGHMGGDVVYLKNEIKASLYITNATRAGYDFGFNLFLDWNNQAGKFKNRAPEVGVNSCGFGWGAKFGDFNNDGLGDIFSSNGYWNLGPKPYWFAYTTYGSGPLYLRGNIQTSNSIPSTKGTRLAGLQQNCVFIQREDSTFEDLAEPAGVSDLENGRGVATGDLNNDGKLDVVVANLNQNPTVYINKTPDNNWIGFQIRSKKYNSYGIGSSIILKTTTGQIRRDLFPANGFAGVNEHRFHFGLGNQQISEIKIIWPDGQESQLEQWKLNEYNNISN